MKTKSNHFSQRAGFTSEYSNSDQDCTRGKNVASTAITTTSATVIVNTNTQPQVQVSRVEPIYYLTKIHRILQEKQCVQ